MSVPIGASFYHFSLGMAPFTGLEAQTKLSLKDKFLKGITQDIVNSEFEAEIIGLKWRYVTNTVTIFGKNYYNFTGLRNFKEKYNPHWEPRYIGIETGLGASMRPIKGLTDTILLIFGGFGSLVKSSVQ